MNECPENSSWKLKLLTSIRILLVLMGVIIVVFGAGGTKVFGLITLIAVAVVYLPALEIEILFLTVVALEYILGNTLGLYGRIAYYDKFMHFTVPFIVALIGMMLIYTAYVYGKIRTSLLIMAFLIVFVTLGLGALLELVEYGYDHYLYQHIEHVLPTGPTQGSPVMDPLADTMFDLLTDLLGGVFGAVTGVILVRRAERKNYCLEWVDDVARFEGIDEDQG
jgi:uncharacterized membrane protein YjdF